MSIHGDGIYIGVKGIYRCTRCCDALNATDALPDHCDDERCGEPVPPLTPAQREHARSLTDARYAATLYRQVEQAIAWCDTGAEPMVAVSALRKFIAGFPMPPAVRAELGLPERLEVKP